MFMEACELILSRAKKLSGKTERQEVGMTNQGYNSLFDLLFLVLLCK
jgi:hypothetical protein